VKKGKLGSYPGFKGIFPDGIIARLTRKCGGDVQYVVDVKCGSFETEIEGANPYSGAYHGYLPYAAENSADLNSDSCFYSADRDAKFDISHRRNNWICYNFKEKRIVPTHDAIRRHGSRSGGNRLKSWLVETSADGVDWQKVAREENNKQLNNSFKISGFAVASGRECRFIRLVDIGRNHGGNDCLHVSAWEIFGSLIE
jgi:hypothetical protein